jgi:hypothetical protein
MESMLLEKYKISAYHESGHIVIAYLSNYWCDSVDINKQLIENDKSVLNYNCDSCLVNSILDYNNNTGNYFSLPENKKIKSSYIAHRVASILVAGSAASTLYKNGYKTLKMAQVVIEKHDLKKINDIQSFLAKEKQIDLPDFVEKTIKYTLDLFHPRVWIAIESLAKKIMLTQNHFILSRKLIENDLYKSGLFSYKESISFIECNE